VTNTAEKYLLVAEAFADSFAGGFAEVQKMITNSPCQVPEETDMAVKLLTLQLGAVDTFLRLAEAARTEAWRALPAQENTDG
jgi:hypothetical protein